VSVPKQAGAESEGGHTFRMPAVAHRPTKPKPSSVTTAGCGRRTGGYCQRFGAPPGAEAHAQGQGGDSRAVKTHTRRLVSTGRWCASPGAVLLREHTLSSVSSHAWPTFSAVSVRISWTSMFLSAGVCERGSGLSAGARDHSTGLWLPGQPRASDACFSQVSCRGRNTHLQLEQPGERRGGALRA
jgi:hypothetical protein